ncbi:MAG: hypothetical protein C0624_11685 [Desulfuromonas sp.]|nr:MAG: hypothetical protein C0624_11685 [Desulfuromonas sp.]
MNYDEIKAEVLALDGEDKKRLILETFSELSREAIKDPNFLMQMFPVFLGVLRDSGMDLQQLVTLASMMSNSERS